MQKASHTSQGRTTRFDAPMQRGAAQCEEKFLPIFRAWKAG
jgi:hypothetical protein